MCCRYINPFPFEVVLAYDDSDDVNMLYEKVHHHAYGLHIVFVPHNMAGGPGFRQVCGAKPQPRHRVAT